MEKNKYFISYNLIIGGDPTPGNMVLEVTGKIDGIEDIEKIEKALLETFQEKFGEAVQGAIINNFIKL